MGGRGRCWLRGGGVGGNGREGVRRTSSLIDMD